jgi:hypothetical protein
MPAKAFVGEARQLLKKSARSRLTLHHTDHLIRYPTRASVGGSRLSSLHFTATYPIVDHRDSSGLLIVCPPGTVGPCVHAV